MKMFSAILVFAFSSASILAAHAEPVPENFSLTCTTSVAGATIYAEDKRVHIHIENPSGNQNFPIYSGTVTPSVVPMIERGAKELSAFDTEVDISWPIEKCKTDPKRPTLIGCAGLGTIETPANVPFVATSIGTSSETVESLDVDAKVINMNFGLSTTGNDFMHYFIALPFDANHCSLISGTGA